GFSGFFFVPDGGWVVVERAEFAGRIPAAMLVRFFDNHGMLTVNAHPQWKTIAGGCSRYIEPITKPLRDRVIAGVEIAKVSRYPGGVMITFVGDERPAMTFDHVVFATHGDRV